MNPIVPNFQRDRFEGQMNYSERELLYNSIMQKKPVNIFEVGMCRGGGSTYYIACAMHNLKIEQPDTFRCFHTSEAFQEFWDYAMKLYGVDGSDGALKDLRPYITFHFGDANEVFPPILRSMELAHMPVDCAVIDGGESSMEALWQFAMFRPYMPVGSIVIFHDWDNGKTDYVRPVITNDCDWNKIGHDIALTVWERVGTRHK